MSHISNATRRVLIGATLLVGLLGCGLLVSVGGAAVEHTHRAGPRITIYTPVVLRHDLTRFPAAWLGRVVWVRARAEQRFVWGCQHDYLCVIRQPSLADPTVDAADARLLLLLPTENRLIAPARRVPLLRPLLRLMSPAYAIAWGRVALYHIRLTATPAYGGPSCVIAQLIDAP
jgi:hypothetical protein